MNIIFYGTPDFAVPSLKLLHESGFKILAVVTAPDKPAGRGLKPGISAVKEFALANQILVLQPEKLKDPNFLETLKKLSPDLQIVVAFRKMPEEVWAFPKLGTFNLHGSLLPSYRGAAPIHRAVMNGEKETGITTFYLEKEIDTGKIIFRETIPIGENETTGELHDRMMIAGSKLVLKTVRAIEEGKVEQKNQSEFVSSDKVLPSAPKIHKQDCKIDWNQSGKQLFNLIRGLSPFPGAFTKIVSPERKAFILKIYRAKFESKPPLQAGKIETDFSTYLGITCKDGILHLIEIQLEGKKKMTISDFLRGNKIGPDWKTE